MNPHLFRGAAAAGLLAVAWVAAGYLRSNPLALLMTLLIGAFYAMGVLELWRYAQATTGLKTALQALAPPPADDTAAHAPWLAQWLARVPASLQTAVALRVQGDRAALPGPALAPYLAGLLVLLGMLGTFVGMVVTLNGTGLALQQATDVQTMRDSLAAPVRGLGLAFGTSVAGVAASAMLGLMSALCRRDRQHAGQLLDSHTTTTLRAFSRTSQDEQRRQAERAATQQQLLAQQEQREQHEQRQAAFRRDELQRQQQMHEQQQTLLQRLHDQALLSQQQLAERQAERQAQLMAGLLAEHLPALAGRLQGVADQMQQHSSHTAQHLQAQQAKFHDQAQQAYRALASAVEHSLQQHIGQALQQASSTLHAAVQATLQGITHETRALQGQAADQVQQQLQGFAQRFEAQSAHWLQTVGAQARQQQAQLVQALAAAQAEQQAQHHVRDEQRLAAWGTALAALAAQVEHTSSRAATQAQEQARSTIAEVARLVHSATEAPRAASEGVAQMVLQLRDKLSDSLARDNAMLEERSRIMATLNTVLAAAQHTASEQKIAVDQMLAGTAQWLQQAGQRYTEQTLASAESLQQASAQLSSSAVEVASLGEAFGAAVDQFSQGSGQLLAQLHSLEQALARNTTRSDEQLAYYVAQAREVIDLSLLSQKHVVDELQRLAGRAAQPQGAASAVVLASAPVFAPVSAPPSAEPTPHPAALGELA